MSKMASLRQALKAAQDKLSNRGSSRGNDGKNLEEQVARLLKKEGFNMVKLNQRVKDSHGNWSEIDVIGQHRSWYNRFFTTSRCIPWGTGSIFVECKQYNPDLRVSLGDVSKFKEVLTLNNIPLKNGLFVTTSSYVPRAGTIGIKTVDGAQLKKWNRDFRPKNPVVAKISGGVKMLTGLTLLTVAYLLVVDMRIARTKTMQPIEDFNDFATFKKITKQLGIDGFRVSTGRNLSDEFPRLAFLYAYCLFALQYAEYKIEGKDTNTLKPPEYIAPQTPSDPYQKHNIAKPPKVGDTFISYEFHPPLPIQQPQRQEAIDFYLDYNQNNETWVPQNWRDYYYKWLSSHDFIVFNTITTSDRFKYALSRLSNEYLTIDQNGKVLFKIPVHHSLSCPNYLLPFIQSKCAKVVELVQYGVDSSKRFAATLDNELNNTISNSKTVKDVQQSSFLDTTIISSTGNLALQTNNEPDEKYAAVAPFTIVTSEGSYGDQYFDNTAENDPFFGGDDDDEENY